MIGLDTNVLARYYIDDEADAEAQRQRLAARRLIESGQPLMVSKSVVLELEWVMRGYYGFAQAEVASVLRHLLEQAHITVEDRDGVEEALEPLFAQAPWHWRCGDQGHQLLDDTGGRVAQRAAGAVDAADRG